MKNYIWIGHYQEGTSDKVWGIIQIGDALDRATSVDLIDDRNWPIANKYVTFRGRRGKKLHTKVWDGSDYDTNLECRRKKKKGYIEVDKTQLDTVYPEFEQDLEKTAVWAMLGSLFVQGLDR